MSTDPTENMRQHFQPDGQPERLDGGTAGAHCAVSTGSGQLTTGARHYGITTDGAASHIAAMLEADPARPLWEDLTGFDRACIAELLAHFRQNGTAQQRRDSDTQNHE